MINTSACRVAHRIGTGGGGFRYLYAILKCFANICQEPKYKQAWTMTNGDMWRQFAGYEGKCKTNNEAGQYDLFTGKCG